MEYGFLRPEDEIFPAIIHVETTNICNLRCIHCPHSDIKKIPHYKPQSISMDLWRRIVDEVRLYPSALRLTPDGEPLIVKEFVDQVAYAQDKGIHTFTLNTNGMLLEGEKAKVLLCPTQTRISVEVSLDGFYRDTYEKIRVGGDYLRVLRNIMNFISERNKRELNNVKLMVSIVQQPEVPDREAELFNRFWSQIADKVIIRNYVDTKGLTPKKMIGERKLEKRWPCSVVFTRLVITYDGGIRFCPDDWMKTTTLSTLDDADSLKAVWQSESFEKLRRSHLKGIFDHPTCSNCTDWKVIRWGADYTTALNSVFSDVKQKSDNNMKYLWNLDKEDRFDERKPC